MLNLRTTLISQLNTFTGAECRVFQDATKALFKHHSTSLLATYTNPFGYGSLPTQRFPSPIPSPKREGIKVAAWPLPYEGTQHRKESKW